MRAPSDHDLVGDGIEEHAHGGDLGALAGEMAVKSVRDGSQHKEEDARSSCSPCACHGKCVGEDPEQQRIMAMRLSVMELGRFMGRGRGRSGRTAYIIALWRGEPCTVAWGTRTWVSGAVDWELVA